MLSGINTEWGFNEGRRSISTAVEMSIVCIVYSQGKVEEA